MSREECCEILKTVNPLQNHSIFFIIIKTLAFVDIMCKFIAIKTWTTMGIKS